MNTKVKHIIFILGMHRSGTSALTGCLKILGLSVGKKTIPPSFDNKKGFFENRLICNLNNQILNLFGCSWDSIETLPEKWIENQQISEFIETACSIINNEFGSDTEILIKDPRICLLLPFWLKVAKTYEATISTIIILRPPEEIAHSLKVRNQIQKNKATLLWFSHLSNAEKNTRDLNRVFISFDELLEKPIETLSKCNRQLKLRLGKKIIKHKKSINQFIDKSFSHKLDIEPNNLDSNSFKRFNSLNDEFLKLTKDSSSKEILIEIDKKVSDLQSILDFHYSGISTKC